MPNDHFGQNDHHDKANGKIATAVKKGIPHNYEDLLPLISI